MKLAKLSLAALCAAGLTTCSFAADTLADAFKEGSVSGALKAYYWDRDGANAHTGIAGDASLFSTGVTLNYITASLNGLSAGFTFQGSNSPFANSEAKELFGSDEYGSGAQLSEAYLAYSLGKTTVQVGRMFLDTPLVNSIKSRINKEAFEGISVVNTDLPNTTLTVAYVQKFQALTDNNGNIGKFTKDAVGEDGVYTLVAVNKSITGLTLTAAYAEEIEENAKYAYAEALYEGGNKDKWHYILASQYYYNNAKSHSDDKSAEMLGFKAGVGYEHLLGFVAYSTVSGSADGIHPGFGGGADLAYTGTLILNWPYAAKTDIYRAGIEYDVTENLLLLGLYTHSDDDNYNVGMPFIGKKDYASILGIYEFHNGSLKGLELEAMYEKEYNDNSNLKDASEFRFNVVYKF